MSRENNTPSAQPFPDQIPPPSEQWGSWDMPREELYISTDQSEIDEITEKRRAIPKVSSVATATPATNPAQPANPVQSATHLPYPVQPTYPASPLATYPTYPVQPVHQPPAPGYAVPPSIQQAPGAMPAYPVPYGWPTWLPARPRQDKYLHSIAILALVGASILILLGLLCGAILLSLSMKPYTINGDMASFFTLIVFICATGSLLIGGAVILYHSICSLQRKPSRRFSLPSYWIWLLVYSAVICNGIGIHATRLDSAYPIWAIILVLSGSFLPMLALIALSQQWLALASFATTWRRVTTALLCGASIMPYLAFFILYLIGTAGFRQTDITNIQQSIVYFFTFVALIVPLLEEILKPILLLPLVKKMHSANEAFFLGLLCGAGYGCIEGTILSSIAYNERLLSSELGLAFVLLQGLCTGLIVRGSYQLSHKASKHVRKGSGSWLSGLGIHILINASIVPVLLPIYIPVFQKWYTVLTPTPLPMIEGIVGIDSVLLMLLVLLTHRQFRGKSPAMDSQQKQGN